MTDDKDHDVSVVKLTSLLRQRKKELKKIHTDIESLHWNMSEMLKASPKFFFQVSNKQKKQRLVLDKKMKELTIMESDMHESINQLAIKISKKAKDV